MGDGDDGELTGNGDDGGLTGEYGGRTGEYDGLIGVYGGLSGVYGGLPGEYGGLTGDDGGLTGDDGVLAYSSSVSEDIDGELLEEWRTELSSLSESLPNIQRSSDEISNPVESVKCCLFMKEPSVLMLRPQIIYLEVGRERREREFAIEIELCQISV